MEMRPASTGSIKDTLCRSPEGQYRVVGPIDVEAEKETTIRLRALMGFAAGKKPTQHS
ncbi:predicted protein [Pyrenophora tritici-repentis Pt-1C-BFP]|uniref:Uncharacterized protein n=1 Tax=Pyrenophora tritici-repentis (strain Pt-1C-BFP) TaxID=426418 RepID=B2W5B5_PYRTR|nr:uncharacterized protein PTRG_04815 [Pyrenophora tritici-repentis Pt-1C-BFP]EDU47722.1 predicted protein [Pyrenophora tritici-repentis Pt-1C-BFP]